MWMYSCISTLLYTITLSGLLQSWGVLSQQHNPPHQEVHGHGHHGKPLEFASEVHNAEHILEHLQNVVSAKSKDQMTEEELEFHYFKLHDYDNNNKLDGVEIGKALTHFHDGSDNSREGTHLGRSYSDEELAQVVDAALMSDDLDGDGYVEYPEFMAAQARRFTEDVDNDGGPPGYDARGAHAPGHEEGWVANPPGV